MNQQMRRKLLRQNSDIIIYTAANGATKLQVQLEDETVWLTQEQMAELFAKGRSTITEHISHIFEEGELLGKVVCRYFRHTTKHEPFTNLHLDPCRLRHEQIESSNRNRS